MATIKQINYIESLINSKECDNLMDSIEARTIRSGLGENLSTSQASGFISILLECPEKTSRIKTVEAENIKQAGDVINHSKFGEGKIIRVDGDIYTIKFNFGTKKIAAGYIK